SRRPGAPPVPHGWTTLPCRHVQAPGRLNHVPVGNALRGVPASRLGTLALSRSGAERHGGRCAVGNALRGVPASRLGTLALSRSGAERHGGRSLQRRRSQIEEGELPCPFAPLRSPAS